jgi:hypothetical protein
MGCSPDAWLQRPAEATIPALPVKPWRARCCGRFLLTAAARFLISLI